MSHRWSKGKKPPEEGGQHEKMANENAAPSDAVADRPVAEPDKDESAGSAESGSASEPSLAEELAGYWRGFINIFWTTLWVLIFVYPVVFAWLGILAADCSFIVGIGLALFTNAEKTPVRASLRGISMGYAAAACIGVMSHHPIIVASLLPPGFAFEWRYVVVASLGLASPIIVFGASRGLYVRSILKPGERAVINYSVLVPQAAIAAVLLTGWLLQRDFEGHYLPAASGYLIPYIVMATAIFIYCIVGYLLGHVLSEKVALTAGIFPELLHYLRAIWWPMAGFVGGYFILIVLFAHLHMMAYQLNPNGAYKGVPAPSFEDVLPQVGALFASSTAGPLSVGLTVEALPPLPAPTIGDFLYFSVITATTTGYGDIVPNSGLARTLASLEVLIGIAWTLVIFALVMVHLQPIVEDIRKKLREKLIVEADK